MAYKALVFQSGGPTQVINRSLYGAVDELRKPQTMKKLGIDGVYGSIQAAEGIIGEEFVDLTDYNLSDLYKVSRTPSSALGTTRYEFMEKDSDGKKKLREADIERCINVLKAQKIKYLLGVGGGDTSETDELLRKYAKYMSYELDVFHIPKTIDNDLPGTDHCPGYGSAATFVINYLLGTYLDARAMGKSIDLNVIMGRKAGWLTSAAAWCRKKGYEPLIIVPEHPMEIEEFIGIAADAYKERGDLLQIALFEGARGIKGGEWIRPLAKEYGLKLRKDKSGREVLSGTPLANLLAQRLSEATGARVVPDTLGYSQRSFLGIHSKVDGDEAEEVARHAVRLATEGKSGIMATIQRNPGPDYSVTYGDVPLSEVARPGEKIIRQIPPEFFDGYGQPNDAFVDWLDPLLGDIKDIAFLNAPHVKKLLPKK